MQAVYSPRKRYHRFHNRLLTELLIVWSVLLPVFLRSLNQKRRTALVLVPRLLSLVSALYRVMPLNRSRFSTLIRIML